MNIKVDGDLQKETYTKNEVKKIIDFCVLATIQDINPRLDSKITEIKLAYEKKEKSQIGNFALGLIMGLIMYHFVFIN